MSESVQESEVQDKSASQTGGEHEPRELPGRRLRAHREESHLSREEVAHHLRLDVQLIKSLEEDDYSQLPSPAYICGYLRSYARMLKLPEDEIVQAYNQGEQISAALIPKNVRIKLKKSGINLALIKTIFIVIIAIAMAGGLYFVAEKFDVFSFSNPTPKRTQLAVPIPTEPSQPGETSVPDQTNSETTIATSPDTEMKTDPQSTEATPTGTSPGTTVIEQLPTPKSKIPNTGVSDNAEQTPVQMAKTVESALSQPVKPAASSQILRLRFLGDSWAEVTDNTGKRLVYQLVKKNADLNLDGEAPFTILLGNAPAVEVFYQGKPFDHTRYHRGEIAYFRVGVK